MNNALKFLMGTTLIVSGCSSISEDDYFFGEIDHQETQYVKVEKEDRLGATINDNMDLYQNQVNENNLDAQDAKLAGVFEEEKKEPVRRDVMGEYGRQLASLRRGLNIPSNIKTDDSIKRKEVEEVRPLEVAKPGDSENIENEYENSKSSIFGNGEEPVEIPSLKDEETDEVAEAKLQREKELDKRPLTDKERRRAVVQKIEDAEEMDAIRASDQELPENMKIVNEGIKDNITIKEKMTPEEERKFLDDIVSGGKEVVEEPSVEKDIKKADITEDNTLEVNSSTPVIENEYDMRSFTSELTAKELEEIARISSHVGEDDFKIKDEVEEKVEQKTKKNSFSEPKENFDFTNRPIVEQLPKREEKVELKPVLKLKRINKLKRPKLKLQPKDSEINFDVLEEE